jgi:hypothetical protein
MVSKRLCSPYRADCWVKFKNPAAPAVTREAEDEWNLGMATKLDLFGQIIDHGFNRGDLSVADEVCADSGLR